MSYPLIDPVALDLGFIQIHWYGLMYVFGFLGGYTLALYRIDRGLFPIHREQMSDFLSWIAVGVILGGRMGYMLFYQPARLIEDPLSLFYVWEGGMAFHGGLLGVIALTWIFARKHQVAPLALGDALAPLIPIGLTEATLKRLKKHENGMVSLIPANQNHHTQIYPSHRVTIQGLFVGLLRFSG